LEEIHRYVQVGKSDHYRHSLPGQLLVNVPLLLSRNETWYSSIMLGGSPKLPQDPMPQCFVSPGPSSHFPVAAGALFRRNNSSGPCNGSIRIDAVMPALLFVSVVALEAGTSLDSFHGHPSNGFHEVGGSIPWIPITHPFRSLRARSIQLLLFVNHHPSSLPSPFFLSFLLFLRLFSLPILHCIDCTPDTYKTVNRLSFTTTKGT
jgi:hypothetical protein